jgi:hypothetical protein
MTFVKVEQITSKGDRGAFLNVEEEYGSVQVWGSIYNRPTYLFRDNDKDGIEFRLIQFDDQDAADEYISEKSKLYNVFQLL